MDLVVEFSFIEIRNRNFQHLISEFEIPSEEFGIFKIGRHIISFGQKIANW